MRHISKLKVSMNGVPVGLLVAERANQVWFEYAPEWIASGFDLSPKTLDFSVKPQLAKDNLFDGLHGVFNDSLPDGWGLLLMDREFKRRYDWSLHDITPLDRLAYIGSRAMGALEYAPEYDHDPIPDEVDLATLAESSEAVLSGTATEVLTQLRIQGGSAGGARPKVTIARSPTDPTCLSGFGDIPEGYSHWIVKFRSENDAPDMGCLEKAYSEMARLAGVLIPRTDIINVANGKKTEMFFAVERFDRGAERKHVLSLAGFLYANFRDPCLDYETVLLATGVLTKNVVEVERAFRLMVFNVMSHNKDDHAKNFSFVADRQGWKLSPGFDLTFCDGMNNEHTTAISGHGNPGLDHVIKIANKFHLHRADQIIGEVRYAIHQWSRLAKEYGVGKGSISDIQKALAVIDKRFESVPMRVFAGEDAPAASEMHEVARGDRPKGA